MLVAISVKADDKIIGLDNQKMYSFAIKRMHLFLYGYKLIWSGGHDRLSCLQNDTACSFA